MKNCNQKLKIDHQASLVSLLIILYTCPLKRFLKFNSERRFFFNNRKEKNCNIKNWNLIAKKLSFTELINSLFFYLFIPLFFNILSRYRKIPL